MCHLERPSCTIRGHDDFTADYCQTGSNPFPCSHWHTQWACVCVCVCGVCVCGERVCVVCVVCYGGNCTECIERGSLGSGQCFLLWFRDSYSEVCYITLQMVLYYPTNGAIYSYITLQMVLYTNDAILPYKWCYITLQMVLYTNGTTFPYKWCYITLQMVLITLQMVLYCPTNGAILPYKWCYITLQCWLMCTNPCMEWASVCWHVSSKGGVCGGGMVGERRRIHLCVCVVHGMPVTFSWSNVVKLNVVKLNVE